MTSMHNIHTVVKEGLGKKISLAPVALKYPFPERPVRALGLVNMNGEVFTSEKLLRVVCMKLTLPVYITVCSTFIRPKLEYDLPVLSCEVVCLGKRRMVLLDIHRTGGMPERPQDADFFNKLVQIRDGYPELFTNRIKMGGDTIQTVFSQAACQFKITKDLDARASTLIAEYLGCFADLINKTSPLAGDALKQAQESFEKYLKTIVDHDPGVKFNKVLFGKKGGVERALDIFYGL